MGYLRRPGDPCLPLYSQMGVSTRDSYYSVLRLCPSGRRKTNLLVPYYLLSSNLPWVVSTLVQLCLRRCVRAVVTVAPHCIAGQDW